MTPEQITNLLDQLGQRLGPAGQHIFDLAVRQVYIDAAIGLGFSLVALAITLWGTLKAVQFTKAHWVKAHEAYQNGTGYSRKPDWDDYVIPWAFVGFVLFFVAGFLVWVALASLSSLLNPEYAALMNILRAVGGTS